MKRRRGLSEDEARLWASVARQARPLRGKRVAEESAKGLSKTTPKTTATKRRLEVPPSVLPDISPTRGEIDPASMQALLDEVEGIAKVEGQSRAPSRLISPLVGEMPAGRGGSVQPPPPQTLMPSYQAPSPPKTPPSLHPIEKPVRRKIAKGRVAIEATIDLHDKTQIMAHYALLGFLRQAQGMGMRHVLIVTGRGASFGSRGVIRRSLPHWFDTPEFRSLVAGYEPAERGHGGDGAFYVRVRRR